MEHRYGSRIDLAMDVDLAVEDSPLGHFPTRNIGDGGMFVETGPIDLQPNDLVRLQLRLNGRRRRLSALVVHRSENGVGLMLMAEDPEYSQFFHDVLEGRRAQSLPARAGAAASVALGGQGQAAEGKRATGGALRWAKDSATLVLRIGERLDISACVTVEQAIESIRTLSAQGLVVDLAATRKVFDSGMALLLLLRDRAKHLQNRIFLANCTPRVLDRLVRAGIASQFRIAATNADRTPFGRLPVLQSEGQDSRNSQLSGA
jgi:anti-anti-sigma regulatory factor